MPRVSIGLPVHNGEKYLEQAINSIRAQTYSSFELIVSDNASTDRTEDICRSHALRDSRIRYSRNSTNIGGANNANLTVQLARGEYFRWASHDDVLAPTLIERLVSVLDNHPEVVLAYSRVIDIDEEGRYLREVDGSPGVFGGPAERFRGLAGWGHLCEPIYGLIRSRVLRETGLHGNYTDADRTLLCRLCLHGRFQQVPEALFLRRYHSEMSTRVYPEWRSRMAWFYPELGNRAYLPHWRQFGDYLRAIHQSPVSWAEKFKCYWFITGRWLILEPHGRRMIKDLVVALPKAGGSLGRELRTGWGTKRRTYRL